MTGNKKSRDNGDLPKGISSIALGHPKEEAEEEKISRVQMNKSTSLAHALSPPKVLSTPSFHFLPFLMICPAILVH